MHGDAHAFRDQRGAEDADAGQQSGELVATNSGHHVPPTHEEPERVAHQAQQRVAGGVAMRVIDVFEAVDVDGEDGERLARDGAQGTIELPPVVQPGERIGRGQGGELLDAFVDGVVGTDPLEEASHVMAGQGDGIDHSSSGALDRLAMDDEHAGKAASGPDGEGHGRADARRCGLVATFRGALGVGHLGGRAPAGSQDAADQRGNGVRGKGPTSGCEGGGSM